MPEPVEVQYRDLLNPIKDPEKSFGVNISELLQSYISNFVQGKVPPNFNSAALLLQGSSSIYGKKVEYLHNLATQLYQSLVKNKKDELIKKDTKERERNNREKENKLNDPFFSIEIKPGKNLSCLRRKKNVPNKKASKKSENSKKYTFVPVDLLPLEGEEKGEIFYDLRGDAVGNKGDYTLNKCRVTESGWLLLPTISPEAIPSIDSPPDYTVEEESDDDSFCIGDDMPDPSPTDEGYPPSSGCSSSPPSAPCSQTPSSQQTEDEGLGSLPPTPVEGGTQLPSHSEEPMEAVSNLDHPSEGIENVPMDGLENDLDLAPRPVRRSMRQALKLCQLEQEGSQNQQEENPVAIQKREEEIFVVKKAIQKKNTCNLPSKLRSLGDDENNSIQPASGYCARTFFSMDNQILKGTLLRCGVSAFGINSKICKRIADHYEVMNKNRSKKKTDDGTDPPEDDLIDVLETGTETVQGADSSDVLLSSPLEDGDIVIDNDPIISLPDDPDFVSATEEVLPLPSTSEHIPELDGDMLIESFNTHSHHVISNALKGVDKNADISRKVHEWEQSIKPFLDQLDQREAFDINLYGSRILNSFEDNNRKQTTTFRNFCKGKEKWEIHRYFMALLPLVNIGNVSIETDNDKDGEEDIFVTLLSRKMHHKELEEFGHNDGGHS